MKPFEAGSVRYFNARSLTLASILLSSTLSGLALPAENPEFTSVRDQIIAAYQKAFDALRRGDVAAALQMDTDDWTSVVAGQAPQSKAERAPYAKYDTPPPEWKVVWRPDYEHNGTLTGIQLYDLEINGKAATVLCLVGSSREELVEGKLHSVWRGSHVRDSWTQTAAGWKRHKHEKLTINERMIDGIPSLAEPQSPR